MGNDGVVKKVNLLGPANQICSKVPEGPVESQCLRFAQDAIDEKDREYCKEEEKAGVDQFVQCMDKNWNKWSTAGTRLAEVSGAKQDVPAMPQVDLPIQIQINISVIPDLVKKFEEVAKVFGNNSLTVEFGEGEKAKKLKTKEDYVEYAKYSLEKALAGGEEKTPLKRLSADMTVAEMEKEAKRQVQYVIGLFKTLLTMAKEKADDAGDIVADGLIKKLENIKPSIKIDEKQLITDLGSLDEYIYKFVDRLETKMGGKLLVDADAKVAYKDEEGKDAEKPLSELLKKLLHGKGSKGSIETDNLSLYRNAANAIVAELCRQAKEAKIVVPGYAAPKTYYAKGGLSTGIAIGESDANGDLSYKLSGSFSGSFGWQSIDEKNSLGLDIEIEGGGGNAIMLSSDLPWQAIPSKDKEFAAALSVLAANGSIRIADYLKLGLTAGLVGSGVSSLKDGIKGNRGAGTSAGPGENIGGVGTSATFVADDDKKAKSKTDITIDAKAGQALNTALAELGAGDGGIVEASVTVKHTHGSEEAELRPSTVKANLAGSTGLGGLSSAQGFVTSLYIDWVVLKSVTLGIEGFVGYSNLGVTGGGYVSGVWETSVEGLAFTLGVGGTAGRRPFAIGVSQEQEGGVIQIVDQPTSSLEMITQTSSFDAALAGSYTLKLDDELGLKFGAKLDAGQTVVSNSDFNSPAVTGGLTLDLLINSDD